MPDAWGLKEMLADAAVPAPARGAVHFVTHLFESPADQRRVGVLVVDDQRSRCAADDRLPGGLGQRGDRCGLHAVADGQTESGALADGPCREERVENLLRSQSIRRCRCRQPRSRGGPGPPRVCWRRRFRLVDLPGWPRLEPCPSAVRRQRQPIGQCQSEVNVGHLQEWRPLLRGVPNQGVDLLPGARRCRPAGEGQQVADDRGRPVRVLAMAFSSSDSGMSRWDNVINSA